MIKDQSTAIKAIFATLGIVEYIVAAILLMCKGDNYVGPALLIFIAPIGVAAIFGCIVGIFNLMFSLISSYEEKFQDYEDSRY